MTTRTETELARLDPAKPQDQTGNLSLIYPISTNTTKDCNMYIMIPPINRWEEIRTSYFLIGQRNSPSGLINVKEPKRVCQATEFYLMTLLLSLRVCYSSNIYIQKPKTSTNTNPSSQKWNQKWQIYTIYWQSFYLNQGYSFTRSSLIYWIMTLSSYPWPIYHHQCYRKISYFHKYNKLSRAKTLTNSLPCP